MSAPHEHDRGAVFLRAIRVALGRVPQWLLVSLLFFALALPVGLMTHQSIADAVRDRYPLEDVLRSFGTDFATDQADERAALADATGVVGGVLAFFAILIGVFLAGGWLQIFLERTEGRSVRRFFHGGLRHFWRFFRVLLIVLVGAAVIDWIVYHEPWHELVETRLFELPEVPHQGAVSGPEYTELRLEELPDELTALRVQWFQAGLHAFLLAMLLVWAIYTRTRLALYDATSAVWAGLCTFFTILRHPIRTLRPMLLLLVVELAIVVVAGSVHSFLEDSLDSGSPIKSLALIFSLSLVVTCLSEILHGARYHAAIQVSRRVLSPISRPDPWKHSVGAPGGPQYPILDASDEYGVSF